MGTAARTSRRPSRHHTAYWREPGPGSFTYVALGDSAAVGVGVEDPEAGYVGVVAAGLAARTGERVRVINLARSGARAADVRARQLPALAELPTPDLVTCVIGGNDVAWPLRFRVEAFAEDLRAIATGLPRGSVLGLVPDFVHWPYDARARAANRAIESAAAAHGHRIADLHTPTSALSLRTYLRTFAADRFHPNEAGHRLWAQAVLDAVGDPVTT